MKQYLVFMTDLGHNRKGNPRGGTTKEFDELASAQSFAEIEKSKWDLVSLRKTIKAGEEGKLIIEYIYGRKTM
jgi:hypothetical protein